MSVSPGGKAQRLFDRFKLIDCLHTSSNTEVWLAQDESAGIAVALKLLSRKAQERTSARQAFEHEWQIARSLNNLHTVRALSWHSDVRTGYAMQYIDGTDLSALVGMPWATYSPAVLVLLDTLDYWHQKGVLHGDLKPPNVLLDRRGLVYLADFGSALVLDSEIATARHGATPAYASPETLSGERVRERDDVYGLARLVAELSGGAPDAAFADDVPRPVARLLRAAMRSGDKRPTLVELRDAMIEAGVSRGAIDLTANRIELRRPAASVASPVTISPMPHGAVAMPTSQTADTAGWSARKVLLGLLIIVVLGIALSKGLSLLLRREPVQPPQLQIAAPDPVQVEVANAPPPDPRARVQSEQVVSELIALFDEIEARGVSVWGGVDYSAMRDAYGAGDRAYLAADHALALQRYEKALGIAKSLSGRVEAEYLAAMSAGRDAYLAADSQSAIAAYERALLITPEDSVATTALERAQNQAQVLALLLKARQADDPRAALAFYEQALALDSEWPETVVGVARSRQTILDADFTAAMSRGYAALDARQFAQAKTAFEQAKILKSDVQAVNNALQQTRIAERLAKIDALVADGQRAEAAENWAQALELYQQIANIDASLDIARSGLARVRERQSINAAVAKTLATPDALSETPALRAASALLTRAGELAPRGPRLATSIGELESLLKNSALPRTVELSSDGLTEVSVLRVARLGSFQSTTLRLRPGLYTAVGSRRGYRDVRKTFRVTASGVLDTVFLVCVDPI